MMKIGAAVATSDHVYESLHSRDSVAEYIVAACSCGWIGAYTHAVERYALDDWWHHIDIVEAA